MAAMPTVAEQLRAGREARGLTVQQVAEVTKLRTDHVRALEEGNFDMFTAPVYIKGFTRTYATLLKLDVPRLMAQLDSELAATEKFSEPPTLTPHPNTPLDYLMLQLSRVRWGPASAVLAALMALLLGLWAYSLWEKARTRDALADLPPAIYEPAGDPAADTLPLPPTK